jgi:hypothetical protein
VTLPPPPDAEPTGGPPADDDLAVVAAELDRAEPGRVAAAIVALGTAIQAVCATLAATAVSAALLGWRAWSGATGATIAAALVGLAGVATSTFIAVRARALATAVAHPAEVLAQARDLVGRAKGSPELGQLARRLAGRRAARSATQLGRARRLVSSGRLVSAVIGLAEPDPQRHGLLLPFTPVRLRTLWIAITIALWTWLASFAVGGLAALTLIVRALS